MRRLAGATSLSLALALCGSACSDEPRANRSESAATGNAGSAPASTSGAGASAAASPPPVSGTSGTSGTSGATAAGAGGESGSRPVLDGAVAVPVDAGSAGADADGAVDAGNVAPRPDPRFLVPATGPCPEFRAGYVMFAPDGVQRRVLLYVSEQAATLDGPLVFSWHSTLPNPEDATSWLGRGVIDEIEAQGGIVAAPSTGYPRERRPWDNTPLGASGTDGDQRLMDEVVACAIAEVGIDVRRIHATGMSAGGLKTAQVSLRRSGYLASVVVYSGGLTQGDVPPDQDPENAFAAMILYGGATDISPVDGILYTDASRIYMERLRTSGRFAFLCDHGGGHSVPRDSQASAWRFMQDHPFGTSPSPYAAQRPDGFLRYCTFDAP
jgi:predicted esterase